MHGLCCWVSIEGSFDVEEGEGRIIRVMGRLIIMQDRYCR